MKLFRVYLVIFPFKEKWFPRKSLCFCIVVLLLCLLKFIHSYIEFIPTFIINNSERHLLLRERERERTAIKWIRPTWTKKDWSDRNGLQWTKWFEADRNEPNGLKWIEVDQIELKLIEVDRNMLIWLNKNIATIMLCFKF